MRRRGAAAGVVALLALGACSDDRPREPESSVSGGEYDETAYCALVREAAVREAPELPQTSTQITPEFLEGLGPTYAKELEFTRRVVAAAPGRLEDEWRSVVDVESTVVENGRKFLDPDYLADFRTKSEDERADALFALLLGPFVELPASDVQTIADDAESRCGVKNLFDDEWA